MIANINTILRKDKRDCSRGSPMGASSFHESEGPLYLQKVRFTDNCYAPDGTYWGSPGNLWCAFNGDDEQFAAGQGSRIYVRAPFRDVAKERVLEGYPDVTFRR